jgi:site-specific DNA-methyltransferase (adenine-specific)
VTATLLYSTPDVAAYHATWSELAEIVRGRGGCDAVIVDAPYSAKVHAGHDVITLRDNVRTGGESRTIDYAPWNADDVDAFVSAWAPLSRVWMVSITDEWLGTAWRESYERAGLVGFPRLPAIETGSSSRKHGDGPSSWTTSVVVARQSGGQHIAAWSPAPYYLGPREIKPVVGGKPLWLMRALVRDYTRPGDLVVDPCAGAFTTGLACKLEGRRFIGGDAMESHAQLGAERLRDLPSEANTRGTLALAWGER